MLIINALSKDYQHFSLAYFLQQKSNARKRCYFGDPGEIRTHDPQFRRLLLYPAELPDHLYVLHVLNRT